MNAVVWVHGIPASSWDQIANYLKGDAHSQGKVQVLIDGKFHALVLARDAESSPSSASDVPGAELGWDGATTEAERATALRALIASYWPQRHSNPSIARPLIRRAIDDLRGLMSGTSPHWGTLRVLKEGGTGT